MTNEERLDRAIDLIENMAMSEFSREDRITLYKAYLGLMEVMQTFVNEEFGFDKEEE